MIAGTLSCRRAGGLGLAETCRCTSRLGGDRRRHGVRLYDAAFATLGTPLWPGSPQGDHAPSPCSAASRAPFVGRLARYSRMAGLARHLLRLRRPASRGDAPLLCRLCCRKAADRRAPRAQRRKRRRRRSDQEEPGREWLLFGLMAAAFSLGWGISSVLSVHLLAILQARGLELAGRGRARRAGRPVAGRRAPVRDDVRQALSSDPTLLISVVLVAAGLRLLAPAYTDCGRAGRLRRRDRHRVDSAGTCRSRSSGPEHYAIWVGRLAGPALSPARCRRR